MRLTLSDLSGEESASSSVFSWLDSALASLCSLFLSSAAFSRDSECVPSSDLSDSSLLASSSLASDFSTLGTSTLVPSLDSASFLTACLDSNFSFCRAGAFSSSSFSFSTFSACSA